MLAEKLLAPTRRLDDLSPTDAMRMRCGAWDGVEASGATGELESFSGVVYRNLL